MCGKHKHAGYCCSQQPWQHAYCFVVNKSLPPWHNTITASGDVSSHQRQFVPAQHAAIPGTGQGQSGLSSPGQLGRAPAEKGPKGRTESGTCGRDQQRADEVILSLILPACVFGNNYNFLGLSQHESQAGVERGSGRLRVPQCLSGWQVWHQ